MSFKNIESTDRRSDNDNIEVRNDCDRELQIFDTVKPKLLKDITTSVGATIISPPLSTKNPLSGDTLSLNTNRHSSRETRKRSFFMDAAVTAATLHPTTKTQHQTPKKKDTISVIKTKSSTPKNNRSASKIKKSRQKEQSISDEEFDSAVVDASNSGNFPHLLLGLDNCNTKL